MSRMKSILRLRANRKSTIRRYPPGYEKTIPWLLGLIGFFILALIVAIVLVVSGALPVLS